MGAVNTPTGTVVDGVAAIIVAERATCVRGQSMVGLPLYNSPC